MSKTLKRMCSFILLLTMAISMLPTAANAEENLTVFATFAELQVLAAQEYSEETRVYYVGDGPLVIEQNLELSTNMDVIMPNDTLFIVPNNVTLSVNGFLNCYELVVEGILQCLSSVYVHKSLTIYGTVFCNNANIGIHGNAAIVGAENIHFSGYGRVTILHDEISSGTILKDICAQATAETRSGWEYQLTINQPITIEDTITIPQNVFLVIDSDVTVYTSGTLELLGFTIIGGHLKVHGTLSNNTNNYSYLGLDGGILEIASDGIYTGTGDICVYTENNSEPTTVLFGIDLSQYAVHCEELWDGRISWYYTHLGITEPPVALPTLTGTYTTDLVMPAADLGVSAPDSVLRATLTFGEDGSASCVWEAVDLTAFRIFFHDMFVNAYYAMAYGAGITDLAEIERFCMESTGLSVSDYMDTLVTDQAMIESFTPASTSGTYFYNADHTAIFTDLAIMEVPSDPSVENSFVLGGNTLYLNAASWDKPDYTFVCTAR